MFLIQQKPLFIHLFFFVLKNQVYVPLICKVYSSLGEKRKEKRNQCFQNSKFVPHCFLYESRSEQLMSKPTRGIRKEEMGVIKCLENHWNYNISQTLG